MAELTPKQRRRGLEFANGLAAMAAAAPDSISKSAVFGAVKMIREYHGFSDEQKRDLILRSLRLGCSTYDDLVNETSLRRSHIIDIVKGMADAGLVEIRAIQHGDRAGRPVAYIAVKQLNTPKK